MSNVKNTDPAGILEVEEESRGILVRTCLLFFSHSLAHD
jgi:hypothetical protein